MAEKSDIYVKVPDGSYVRFPAGTPPQIMSQVVRSQIAPERPGMPAFPPVGYKPTDAAYNKGARETKGFEMKESAAPGLVKAATGTLPLVGGLGGAIAGAPAFGGGALVGGGLGAAGGEAARQGINKAIFQYGDEKEGPQSAKESAKQVGAAGLVGAASEVPAAVAISMGNRVLSRLVQFKSPREAGDAMKALMDASPAGFTLKGFTRDLGEAYQKLSQQVGQALKGSTQQLPVDLAIKNATQEAKAANAALPGIATRFNRIIEAAKLNAGIKGPTATPQQLFNFQERSCGACLRGQSRGGSGSTEGHPASRLRGIEQPSQDGRSRCRCPTEGIDQPSCGQQRHQELQAGMGSYNSVIGGAASPYRGGCFTAGYGSGNRGFRQGQTSGERDSGSRY